MLAHYQKDPNAVLDYTIDWTAWLPAGDSVVSAAWIVDGTVTQPKPPQLSGAKCTVWLAGGTLKSTSKVTCRVTTAHGRVDDRSIGVTIGER